MNWKSALTGMACGLLALPSLSNAQSAKIKMGSSLSPPSLESITPYVAVEKGFFKKYGLDVEVVEFRGDNTHVKALLSGDIDMSINMGATEGIVGAALYLAVLVLVGIGVLVTTGVAVLTSVAVGVLVTADGLATGLRLGEAVAVAVTVPQGRVV